MITIGMHKARSIMIARWVGVGSSNAKQTACTPPRQKRLRRRLPAMRSRSKRRRTRPLRSRPPAPTTTRCPDPYASVSARSARRRRECRRLASAPDRRDKSAKSRQVCQDSISSIRRTVKLTVTRSAQLDCGPTAGVAATQASLSSAARCRSPGRLQPQPIVNAGQRPATALDPAAQDAAAASADPR